jgi:peptidyl-prolyl isomerase H (cyclophilin H)
MATALLATKAYLTISHGDTTLGTLRLTLRPDIVPRTVENFVHFLTTTRSSSSSSADGYCNSTFHRIIPKFMAQGGDFINHDGTGSTSIYGPSFPDENFHLSHSQRGTLSMANSGKDTNGCQFFISFCPTAHLDGRHVVFGCVDWRDDAESADVLDKLERVRTDRRNGDRPLERVQIVDCGILDERNNKATNTLQQKDNAFINSSAEEGKKLAGEAKKNKLLQAYGDKNPATADDDEIDLDDDDEEEEEEEETNDNVDKKSTKKDAGEIDLDDENDHQPAAGDNYDQRPAAEVSYEQNNSKVSSKKAALQKRLAALRTKINQSRTLNRREVHAEATRLGTEEANLKERKRQNKQDRQSKQSEYDTYVVGKLQSVGGTDKRASADSKAEQKKLASLSQPALDSIRQMNARSEKKERSQFGVNDYYNPEGQYSNYERNLKSIRHRGAGPATTTDSYDPTMASYANNNDSSSAAKVSERDGAKRLANEMKRRAEKKANQKRKIDFDETDVSYINDRNKRFNQKISRNFDEHTAEIRQNLERGTAL